MLRGSVTRPLILAVLLSGMSLAAAAPGAASAPCTPLPVTHRAAQIIPAQPTQHGLGVASLNMAGKPQIEDALTAWAQQRGIDILLLQEVGDLSVDGATFVAALSERLGFHFAYAPANVFAEARTQGLAIVSRHPITDVQVYELKHHRLRFRSRCRIALAATVTTADGPVRTVNVHLDTRINSSDRIAQLAPVLDRLQGDDRPQIIGGDFNTMDIGWYQSMWPFPYVQRQAKGVRPLLTGDGFHTPFDDTKPTFKFLGLPLRLDWIFLKDLNAIDRSVDDVRFSDHRGVWTRVTNGLPTSGCAPSTARSHCR
jgi:endonuclease/exonuclease/phosphatase family metal-dependent hydrolase